MVQLKCETGGVVQAGLELIHENATSGHITSVSIHPETNHAWALATLKFAVARDAEILTDHDGREWLVSQRGTYK